MPTDIILAVVASTGFWSLILYFVQRRDNRNDKINNALRALLRHDIVEAHRLYTRLGYCSITDRQDIVEIYTAYHDLGGNDIATDLKDDIMKLPVREKEAE